MPNTSPTLVPLRRAAEIVATSLKNVDRTRLRGPEYLLALTSTALELSFHVPLFHLDAQRNLRRIAVADLKEGTFHDGGNLLLLPSGTSYRRLLVRRNDIMKVLDSPALLEQAPAHEEMAPRD